jgi:hypothetical protein
MAQLLQPKQQLAGYELGELVGKGGMGEVYRARQMSMDRVVALKILAPRLAKQDPIFAKRFVDEARAAGRLNHPNIIAVHDVGKAPMPGAEPGTPELDYFSMEFVDGESVKDVIERQGILPLSLTGQVMLGMSEALVYAEAQGIVHRDIKPDNIMITSGGIVKLADLGLALQIGGEDGLGEKDEQGRGKVMGTPLYMSPEQARALPVDSHSDQYSLGATLFHMLTGKPPFKGESAKAIMKSHVFDPVPDPRQLNAEVPEVWRQLCMKMMAKNPEERFPTCVQMRAAVQAAISGQGGPGASKRVRTNGWAMAKERANVMPGWARMLVYGFACAVVAMVAFFAIPWGGGGHASVEPVKPPVAIAPPVDQQAAAAKQMDRVRQALQALPFEPDKALPMLDALAGDKTITLPAARELIAQETVKRKAQLEERLRKQQEAEHEKLRLTKAAEAQKAMAAGNLAQVKECLTALEPEFDKLPKIQQERVAVVRQQYQVALIDVQKRFTDRIVQSQKAPELAAVLAEIKTSPLGEDALRSLGELAAKRGAELGKGAATPSADDQAQWQALSDQLEPLRGSFSYKEVKNVVEAEAPRFTSAQGRELAQSLAQLGSLSITAEASLRNFITTTGPTVEVQIGSQTRKVKLRRIDSKEVEFLPLDIKGDVPLRQDRKTVQLPLRELVEQSLAGDGIEGAERWRVLACILWVWRVPESAEILAKIADEPLAKAVALIEARARVLDLRARVVKNGKQVVVTYDTSGKNPWFAEDFVSEDPASVGDKGLSWGSSRMSPVGTPEPQVPTLRWKVALLPPLNLTYQFYLKPSTQLIALGVLGGDRRVRAAFNNLTGIHKIFPLLTKDDGSTYEYQTAWVKNGFFKSTETVRVDFAVNADFKATVKYNEQLLKDGLALPPGQPITPIVQSVQYKAGQTAVDLSMMSISGVLPEDGAGK